VKRPKIWQFPINISAMAEASNFKFGVQLGFATTHHKEHTLRKKWVQPKARGALKNLRVPLHYF